MVAVVLAEAFEGGEENSYLEYASILDKMAPCPLQGNSLPLEWLLAPLKG